MYDPTMVDTCHYKFVQTRRIYNPEMNLNINCYLGDNDVLV